MWEKPAYRNRFGEYETLRPEMEDGEVECVSAYAEQGS